ncbi:MAG: efflux RND transporter periplasmic adaptor subunit [Pseudomonadota bacterium]
MAWLKATGVYWAAVLSLAGCADRSIPEPADQMVRPARIFEVRDSSATLSYEFVGRVEAAQSIDMTFEVSGPLKQMPVLEGQTIAAGDLVAALDPTDFELAVQEAEVQLQLARQDLERKRQVLAQKGIARSVVDDARSMHQLQQVRLEKARQSLADTRMTAPFDAYVARRYVDNHVNVNAGQNIVRLHDLHVLEVVANVPESLVGTASREELLTAYAQFDFIPDERFELTYRENRGEADAVAQTYAVSMSMQRPDRWNILPGMTATVTTQLRDPSGGTFRAVIPPSALVGDSEQGFEVWVFDRESGAVAQRAVGVGEPVGEGVEILHGLSNGDLVVATGASQLQSGMRVSVLGEITSTL